MDKTLIFLLIILATIIFVRIGALIHDPNPTIFGYELHHLYYGIILLVIAAFLLIFVPLSSNIFLITSGIGIGLIIDELFFIIRKLPNSEYQSTFPNAIILFILFSLVVLLIKFKK